MLGHPGYPKAEQPPAAALVLCRLAVRLGDSSSTQCHRVAHQYPRHAEERGACWHRGRVMDGCRAVMGGGGGGGSREQHHQYITLLGRGKSPLEPYRMRGSGSGAAAAHTLREVPFLTGKCFGVSLPWSCPLVPRAGALGTRQPPLATGSGTSSGCKSPSKRICSSPGLLQGPEGLD